MFEHYQRPPKLSPNKFEVGMKKVKKHSETQAFNGSTSRTSI